MSAADLVGINAGDALASGQYFRVAFEPFAPAWLVASADFAKDIRELQAKLSRGGVPDATWVTPLNVPSVLPGETVAVIDCRVIGPPARATVADLVNVLEHATLALSVRSVARIASGNANSGDRAQATQAEQDRQRKEGWPDVLAKWIKRLGVVLVAAVVIGVVLHLRGRK